VDCDCLQLIKEFHQLVKSELGIVYIDYAQIPGVRPPLHKKWSQRAYQRCHRRVFELRREGYNKNPQKTLLNGKTSVLDKPHLSRARRSLSFPVASTAYSAPPGEKTCECTTCLDIVRLSKPIVLGSTGTIRSNVVIERDFGAPLFGKGISKSLSSQFPQSDNSPAVKRSQTAPLPTPYRLHLKTHIFPIQPLNLSLIPSPSNLDIRLDMRNDNFRASQKPMTEKVIGRPAELEVSDSRQERDVEEPQQQYTPSKSSQSSQLALGNEKIMLSTTQVVLTPASSAFTYSPSPADSFCGSPLTYSNNIPFSLDKRTDGNAIQQLFLGTPQAARHTEIRTMAKSPNNMKERLTSSSPSHTLQRNNSHASVEQSDSPQSSSREEALYLMTPPASSPTPYRRQSSDSPKAPSPENNRIQAPVILPPNWRNRLLKHGKGHMIPDYEAAGARSGTPAPEGLKTPHNAVFAAATAAQKGRRAAINASSRPIGHILPRREKKLGIRSRAMVQAGAMEMQSIEQDDPRQRQRQRRENEDVEMEDARSSPMVEKRLNPPNLTPAQRMAQLGGVLGRNGVFVPLTPIEQRQVLLGQRARAIRMGLGNRDEMVELLAKHSEAV